MYDCFFKFSHKKNVWSFAFEAKDESSVKKGRETFTEAFMVPWDENTLNNPDPELGPHRLRELRRYLGYDESWMEWWKTILTDEEKEKLKKWEMEKEKAKEKEKQLEQVANKG